MNEFDFLSRMPIGQYVVQDSIIHRLDPRAKVFLFTLIIIAVTFGQSLIAMSVALGVIMVLTFLSKINLKFALKSIVAPLPFLLLFALIQTFLLSSTKNAEILFSFSIFRATTSSVTAGIILLMRFLGLILAISLTTLCTSTSEFVQGLQRLLSPINRIGIKTMDMVMVLQITIRFIPLLAQTAERIAKNQASRGAEWGTKGGGFFSRVKRLFPLLVPLFVISIRRAEVLALAMDARAYGYLEERTSMAELHFSTADVFFVSITIIVSLLVLLA